MLLRNRRLKLGGTKEGGWYVFIIDGWRGEGHVAVEDAIKF